MIRSNRNKLLWLTATASIAAAVFLYPTDRLPEAALSAKAPTLHQPEPPVFPNTSASAFSRSEPVRTPAAETPPQILSGEVASTEEPPPPMPGTPRTYPKEIPYIPSPEEQKLYGELKSKAYSNGMTMRSFLKLREFSELPEPMRRKLFGEVLAMAMHGELDRKQFLEERPPQP